MSYPRQFGICDSLGCTNSVIATIHHRVFCVDLDPKRGKVYRNVFYYCPNCSRHFSDFEKGRYNVESTLQEVEIKYITRLIIDELVKTI